jgi:KDO2-lipid IV(A) lauroyltransferase
LRALVQTIAWLLSRLPLRALHALGAGAGLLVYASSPSYRAKLDQTLQVAGLSSGRMRRRAAAEAGRFALELPWVWLRPLDEVLSRIEPIDWSPLNRVAAQGKGVLLLTPHLGCFEVAARCRAKLAPITVLYKPPRQPALRALVEGARTIPGLSAAPANLAGVRALLRALRRGEVVGLLPDQVPDAGEGEWAPFFGRPAYTMTLPGRLAQSSGAGVCLLVAERLSQGRGWRVHVDAFADSPTPSALNAAMERLVRRFPEQYLWGYNRYKQPAGVPGPTGPLSPVATVTPVSPDSTITAPPP